MSLFDEPKKSSRAKSAPFYRVETSDDNQYDYEPGSTVEAVGVDGEAHYVVKGPDTKVHGMHPFKAVVCVRLVEDEDFEAEE